MTNRVQTLDLRPFPPWERHEKIFALWEGLAPGESLKIINDHDPKPLYYLFESEYKGQFQWTWETRGPKDWVFLIKKWAPVSTSAGTAGAEEDKEALKALLKKLHAGADVAEIKEQAKSFLGSIDPQKLALLEQEIIQEGVSREEMRRLCDAHLEVMKSALDVAKPEPEPGHPVHTFMEEHKAIKSYLAALDNILKKAQANGGVETLSRNRETIQHIAHHLLEADKHHQREEEALFPALRKHGITEPPAIMLQEHEELKAKKRTLLKLSQDSTHLIEQEWREKLIETGSYLVEELPNHIYKEDNILYQMALQTLSAEEWAVIKGMCDRIGYCCFTPAH